MTDHLTKKLVYSIIKDVGDNLFLTGNVPIENVKDISSEIYEIAVGEKMSFRKPSQPKTKSTRSKLPTKNPIKEIHWQEVPGLDRKFTKDILLSGYYPFCDTKTGKCLAAINDTSSRMLTTSDKKILARFNIYF